MSRLVLMPWTHAGLVPSAGPYHVNVSEVLASLTQPSPGLEPATSASGAAGNVPVAAAAAKGRADRGAGSAAEPAGPVDERHITLVAAPTVAQAEQAGSQGRGSSPGSSAPPTAAAAAASSMTGGTSAASEAGAQLEAEPGIRGGYANSRAVGITPEDVNEMASAAGGFTKRAATGQAVRLPATDVLCSGVIDGKGVRRPPGAAQ